MTRNTETYDLRTEADRIDARLDELAEKVARLNNEADDEDDEKNRQLVGDIEEALEEVDQLERELVGVRWAIEEWGDNKCGTELDNGETCQNDAGSCPHHDSEGTGTVEVTVGGLTTGEFADVQDRTETARQEKEGWGAEPSVNAAGSIFQAAKGLVSADFLSEDAKFFEKQQTISNSAPQFKEWLSARVDEQTTPDVDVGNFSERLEKAQANLT